MFSFALETSKTGVLGLRARKRTKVAIPNIIRSMQKIKHKAAPHHIHGFVRVVLSRKGTIVLFKGCDSIPSCVGVAGLFWDKGDLETITSVRAFGVVGVGVDCLLLGVVLHGVLIGLNHLDDGVSHGGVSGGCDWGVEGRLDMAFLCLDGWRSKKMKEETLKVCVLWVSWWYENKMCV